MNQKDFQGDTELHSGHNLDGSSKDFLPHQQFAEMSSYAFPSDFVPSGSPEAMSFNGFSDQFMQMPYGFMPYTPNYGGFYERKSYGSYKKKFNPRYTTTQRIYTKKPKQPLQVNPDSNGDASNYSPESKDRNADVEKLPHNIQKAKFFVIKSYSEEDVHKAIKHNVWCSTKEGNVKLHDAFVSANGEYPIFLLFSVNSSGHFVGVAQMKSHVDFEKNFQGWNQNHKWKGVFKISWIYIKDVPNRELRHLKNDLNEGKPVPNSRDCQELLCDVGIQVLEIFENYKSPTSILDDYDYYEMQERARG